MSNWAADFGNDPDRDFALIVEVMEGNEFRARFERQDTGELVLRVYPTSSGFCIPARWLADLIDTANTELPKST